MRINIIIMSIVIIAASIFAYYDAKYTLGDNDQVVVTQFGKVFGRAKDVPGEYFKIPIIQKVHYIKKNYFLTEWSQEIPTRDKKILLLTTKTHWIISDPILYYTTLNSYNRAKTWVSKHTGTAEREYVTSHTLAELMGNQFTEKSVDMVDCSQLVEHSILDSAKKPISEVGLKLSDVELFVTWPIKK